MAGQVHKRYVLGEYWLEPEARRVVRGGEVVHLANRPLRVLLYLIENRDRLVSRSELLEAFWDGREVYDDSLRKAVGAIRRALGDRKDDPRFIETRWAGGYRYVGPLEETFVEPAVYEVERTRGVRIVVHEEIQDVPPAEAGAKEEAAAAAGDGAELTPGRATRPLAASSPSRLAPLSRRKAAFALAAFALAAFACAALLVGRAGRAHEDARPAPPPRSLAVLPLKNLTGEPADEYMSDGITESLITSLSRVGGVKVISRGSAFSLKGKEVDAREAGRSLGVAAVLEGSLRKSGDRVRVDVRLVSTEDGRVLWASDAYDRPAGDILAVQDEITRNVVAGLTHRLSAEDERRLSGQHTRSAAAYQEYLKGRYHLNKRSPEGIGKAIEYFRGAVEIDPNYALAYAALAESYDKAFQYAEAYPRETLARERAAAERALALDDSLAEAHVAMATFYANEWNLPDSAREEERAIEIDPNNAEARHNYAYRLIDLGRPDEAVAQVKRARDLDPLNVVMNVDVGEILLFARRYDEAIGALRLALEMDPQRANAHDRLGWAYVSKGMKAEAVEEFLKAFTLAGQPPATVASLREAYASGEMRDFWRKRVETELAGGYPEPTVMALFYVQLGDKDQALSWLERGYRERSPLLVGLKSSPYLDPLRSDQRYDDLVRRVGLP